jgi:hypothetical protein
MVIVAVLVFILVAMFGILGLIFFSLKQESVRSEELFAVPIADASVLVQGVKSRVEVQAPVKTADRGLDDIPWRTPSLVGKNVSVEPLEKISVPKQDEMPLAKALVADDRKAFEDQVFQLKEEVKQTREKAVEQARNALDVISKLRESNDRVSAENEQLKAHKPQLGEGETSHLKAENAALKSEISRYEEERSKLLQDKELLRSDFDRKIQQAGESVSSAEIEYKKSLSALFEDIESLRRVNEELKASRNITPVKENENVADVRAKISFLETDNARLKEKNEFLQYELTKIKAQSAGLQRVCDNFRKKEEGGQAHPFMSASISRVGDDEKDITADR